MMFTKAVSWESTYPNYLQSTIAVKNMRMNISVGSHVVVKVKTPLESNIISEYAIGGTIVVTIVSYTSDDNISCVLFRNAQSVKQSYNIPSPIMSGLGYGMNELFRTKYQVVISVDDIIDYAFIFSHDDIEQDVISYYGICHAYLVRFQFDNGVVEPVEGFFKFPCESEPERFYERSHVAKIWYGVTRIQDGLWKVMNSESERQVMVVRVPLNIDEGVLDYIVYRCNGEVKKNVMKS